MSLVRITSPHTQAARRTARMMQWVLLAAVPGIAVQVGFFGVGVLINLTLCSVVALGSEAVILTLRRKPVGFYLSDYSALVTALLLGVALPPLAPWWVAVVATAFAMIFVKHLYGGLGYNPFNPAMAGYALVLVSFPVAMTTSWAAPSTAIAHLPDLNTVLSAIFGGGVALDGYTMATPLDVYKHEIGAGTADVVRQLPMFGSFVAAGWEWVNLAYLAGGVLLIALRVISWHIPVSLLAALSVMSLAFGWDADQHVPLSLHLLGGATMLGAFFIATDPVSAATTPTGRLIYGAGIGILLYVIRTWGSYPDAIAFSVLLMNFAAPLIDYYTPTRVYGHARKVDDTSEDAA